MLATQQALPPHLLPADPSYAVIARILAEDRAVTPDADLSALIAAFGADESSRTGSKIVLVKRNREGGGAGFAFDRDSMKITSLPKDGRYPAMQLGDVIVAVNGEAVAGLSDYNRLARGIPEFRLSLQPSTPPTVQRSAPSAPSSQPRRSAPKAKPKRQARAINTSEWDAMALNIDNMSYEELLFLEEAQGAVVQPGLRDVEIDSYPVEHVCGGGSECAICLEDFCDGEEVMRLPCMHTFHSSCSRDWLRRQAKCPCCNFDLKM